jgi:hypothetical protein
MMQLFHWRTCFLVLCVLSCLSGIHAGAQTTTWVSGETVTFMDQTSTGQIVVGVTPVPAGTCSMYGAYQFIFDATTTTGKNSLAILLTAITTKHPITITYTYSSVPGTNQTNGCTFATLSPALAIGFAYI